MATYPAGSFNDGGREYSSDLEQIGKVKEEGMSGSPLIFPNNIGSPGGFNNHFMIIDILTEDASLPMSRAAGGLNWLDNGLNNVFAGRTPERKIYPADRSIVLYMPNTLAFTTQNDYEDVSLTSIIQKVAPAISGGMARAAIDFGLETGKFLGAPVNPATEVIFSNTTLRKFQFDFLFAPSTEPESNTLRNIVFEMRRAASVRKRTVSIFNSLLWIPPRKLQIRFYKKIDGITEENDAFPKLKPCVIENLDFDFAPTGAFSAFSNGYPVSMRMMLRVKEDEVIDRDFIETNDRKPEDRR